MKWRHSKNPLSFLTHLHIHTHTHTHTHNEWYVTSPFLCVSVTINYVFFLERCEKDIPGTVEVRSQHRFPLEALEIFLQKHVSGIIDE
jgi:hypothetical protein